MKDLEIGKKVYARPHGNHARRTNEIKEFTVSKIGRKYFQVEELRDKIHIDTGLVKSDYVSDWKFYNSTREIEDEKRKEYLDFKISSLFNYSRSKIDLDKLESIAEIIGIEDD